MRVITFSSVLLALTIPSLASPIKFRSPYAVKDAHPPPRGWERIARAQPNHQIELRIGLKQSQFKGLERHLYGVSDPANPLYGSHLSADEVHQLVRPSEETSALVHEWLLNNGIPSSKLEYSPAKDWIKIKMSVVEVERLLDTEYHLYLREDGLAAVRAPTWSLPSHLHDHIETIQPTNSFFGPKRQATLNQRKNGLIAGDAIDPATLPPKPNATTIEAVCDYYMITPLCLRTLYGTINYTVQAAEKNKMSLNNFLGEVNLRSDAHLFLQRYRPDAISVADEFQQISIAGGTVQQTPLNQTQLVVGTGLEGNLDVQTMLGIAWPTPLTAYSTGTEPPFTPDAFTTTNTNEPYLVWLEYILSQPDPLPSIVSTSYDDDEQSVPKSYAIQVCNALAQLGARGVTVLFASGDNGVGQSGYCYKNDGTNTPYFLPNFPSTCPYVTSVGGTMLFEPEVAVRRAPSNQPLYTAGGGFSDYFPRPRYQDSAISTYLNQTLGTQFQGLYNPDGRGYPDIAAQSLNFMTYWNGALHPVSGTSAATPAAAAILALVNDALIATGRPTLGFINPWLYSEGYKAFNDILSGSSEGCDSTGFVAAPGWDGVTGHGTPNFRDILALLGLGCKNGTGHK